MKSMQNLLSRRISKQNKLNSELNNHISINKFDEYKSQEVSIIFNFVTVNVWFKITIK